MRVSVPSDAERASALMKRGIALLETNQPDSLKEALNCFDEALALRRALPPTGYPWEKHVLAASWMNRADALTRLGSEENLSEAVCSYDEAIAVLREVPLDANPLFRRRMAVAWINRGITLQKQGRADALLDARASLEEGIRTVADSAEHAAVAACGWMNLANVRLQIDAADGSVHEAAQRAIALLGELPSSDEAAAETALQARYIRCQAVAEAIGREPAAAQSLSAEALRQVEEGLQLARSWESQPRFRTLAAELFRFGAVVAQQFRSTELTKLVQDSLPTEAGDATPELIRMHVAAVETLTREWQELQKEGYASFNTPRFAHWLETLRILRTTQGRLRELTRSAAPSLTGHKQQG